MHITMTKIGKIESGLKNQELEKIYIYEKVFTVT